MTPAMVVLGSHRQAEPLVPVMACKFKSFVVWASSTMPESPAAGVFY